MRIVKAGDIGKPLRHVEIEPIPDTEPVHEPAHAPAEPAPAAVPEPDRESVPA